jgi:hypothetical protein
VIFKGCEAFSFLKNKPNPYYGRKDLDFMTASYTAKSSPDKAAASVRPLF